MKKALRNGKIKTLSIINHMIPNCFWDASVKKKTKLFKNDILPTHLAIETTNICNAKCYFCPSHIHSREKGTMGFPLFKNIIDQASQYKCIEFISHGGLGEPLMDRGIFEKIKYEKKKLNVKVQLHTNGSMLNTTNIKKLFDSELDTLSISVNAFYKDSYAKIIDLDYDRLMENIENCIDLKQRIKPNTKIRLTLVNSSLLQIDEADKFRNYWIKHNVSVVVHNDKNWATFSENKFKNKKKFPCKWLWSVINIFWNGDVSICHEDYNGLHILGNIFDNNLLEIFNSQVIRDFRKMHHERNFNNFEICSNCSKLHSELDYWKKVSINKNDNHCTFSYIEPC